MKKENVLNHTKPSPLKMAPYPPDPISGSLGGATTWITASSSNPGLSSVSISSTVQSMPIRGATPRGEEQITFVRICRPVYVLEKHITVIRKGPTAPPSIQMYTWEDSADLEVAAELGVSGAISQDDLITIETSFAPSAMPAGTGTDGSDVSIFYNNDTKVIKGPTDSVTLPIDYATGGPNSEPLDWNIGYVLILTHIFTNQFGNSVSATARLVITNTSVVNEITCDILAITDNFPLDFNTTSTPYVVTAEQIPPLFEFKFPRFAYRYKYEDGEYSVFSPWSEVTFMPGEFDFLPKKGYNLGMANNMRYLKVRDWIPKNIPKDVVQVDLLYKESNSPNIYTVESFKEDDPADFPNPCPTNQFGGFNVNHWNACGTGDNFGSYAVTSELIHQVVSSNQLLRPWDNVPRLALGQEITANRLIYANYIQNYDTVDPNGNLIKPKFGIHLDYDDLTSGLAGEPAKSLKSMRTYQLGVVYRDRYGRETPVLTSESGSVEVGKSSAKLQTRLNAAIQSPAPDWAESYTFYIKETSNEYYNLAMDRWYDAEDDGVWLSFPSSERNKVGDDTILILKKQHDTDVPVESDSRYKVVAIKNNAPLFIKTENKFWGSLPMMLPPPGWGEGGKPGGWDSGMFYITGLPLPDRLYIDVYAEYWDQSVLFGLEGAEFGAQVRVIQSENLASAYNATPASSSNASKWYDVAKISYIGAPPQFYEEESMDYAGNMVTREVEIPGQAEQIVRITLEEIMGADMSFCQPTDNLSLARGLSIEARTKVVRDRAQFEGRFFVKVLRDSDVQTHIIQPNQSSTDYWQVLAARDIRYICAAHPGVQEACRGEAGTAGAGLGKWYGNYDEDNANTSSFNYIPIGKNWTAGAGVAVANGYGIQVPDQKYEVSSFSHTAEDAHWLDYQNAPNPPPQSGSMWPYGPSLLTNPLMMTGWWYNAYDEYINSTTASQYASYYNATTVCVNPTFPNYQFAVLPNVSTIERNWPSFIFHDWDPLTCDSSGGLTDCANLNPLCYPTGDFRGGIDLSEANNPSAMFPNSTMQAMMGGTAYYVPAIWGDQSDLLGYTGVGVGQVNNTPANYAASLSGISTGPKSMWKANTINKIRKDWYYLYHGQQKISTDWPRGKFSPNRWFIDKVGAAAGYSGNGIWTDTSGPTGTAVSKMHLSFYGIGSLNTRQRDFNLLAEQENEYAFGLLLATPGTQFRFKSDPHQIVYTVIEADHENVKNYESSHGSWAYNDPINLGTATGGGNLGNNQFPPWGSRNIGTNSVAGKSAFFSDLFNSKRELTGGALYNWRVRIRITLDKEIGNDPASTVPIGSAQMGFHPLLNHVDADGNCNIDIGGAQTYWDGAAGATPADWIASPQTLLAGSQDVLPTPNKFYNLSSYWNRNTAPASGQSSTRNDTEYANGQHFGLHERGLNATTIEIVTPYKGDEVHKKMSNNPAIWETEPKEDVGLDIYYAASPSYPVNTIRYRSDADRPDPTDVDINGNFTWANWYDYGYRGEEMIPVGATVVASGPSQFLADGVTLNPAWSATAVYNIWTDVAGVQGNTIWTYSHLKEDPVNIPVPLTSADSVKFFWKGEGNYYGAQNDNLLFWTGVDDAIDEIVFKIDPNTHDKRRTLPYFNCYTFFNGVESNRVRDDYNAVTIDKGVKASAPLAEQYEEERRASSLIFSGIYNSTSGVNRTNQFIQAEPITKDLNPVNGSIQRLFARDTDLVTFCENKVFKILAKKDALFNADGNTNVTSNAMVLGQSIPFVGEYGISRNPESLASESYRLYFSDKDRGAILRLSRDGLTPISSQGMKDWFRDNLRFATSIIGSYDDRQENYNVTIETQDQDGNDKAYTLSYTESKRGWESFKSFVHQGGVSHKNLYYTFPSNVYSNVATNDPWGVPYSSGIGSAETYQHSLDLRTNRISSANISGSSTITYGSNPNNIILEGMNVEGNGVPYGTRVLTVNSNTSADLSNDVYLNNGERLKFTTPRNRFYEQDHYSMVKTVFNKDQGSVKRFKTLNYEGSQAQIVPRSGAAITANFHSIEGQQQGRIYLDNYEKDGWYVENIKTDLQEGTLYEFVNKENKWFDYIRGKDDNLIGNELDTGDFSLQGIGFLGGDTALDPTNQQ